jgi:sortase (surface protein transpeptidase)
MCVICLYFEKYAILKFFEKMDTSRKEQEQREQQEQQDHPRKEQEQREQQEQQDQQEQQLEPEERLKRRDADRIRFAKEMDELMNSTSYKPGLGIHDWRNRLVGCTDPPHYNTRIYNYQ